jgi:hypothetical protein
VTFINCRTKRHIQNLTSFHGWLDPTIIYRDPVHKDTSEQLGEINNEVNVLNSSTALPINVILSTAVVQVQDKAGNFTQLRA